MGHSMATEQKRGGTPTIIKDIAQMRQVPIFSRLSTPELESLRFKLKVRDIKKNMLFMRADTEGAEMFFLASGQVRVYRTGEKGREFTLALLDQGDFFGEIALLTGSPRTANVLATTRVILWELSRTDFIEHTRRFSGLPLFLAQSLANRLRLASGNLADIALLDVPHRIVRALEKMSLTHPLTRERYIPKRPTHREIADMIGTSREVVSRCLKTFESKGIIRADGRELYLHPEELE
jgi:CRP/FNR family cyclic AMP-dependent transcriptional regulator